jgi:AcrR family transcriptional regulator
MNRDSQAQPAQTPLAPRAERRRLATQSRVLEAATELFSENGFFETSMASVADRADVAVGTLYNLFDSKDALYRELVHRKTVDFRNRLVAALREDQSATRAIERFVETLFELYCDEAPMLQLYYRISGSHISVRASFDEHSRDVYDETLRELAAVIQRGVDAGEFRATSDVFRAAAAIQAIANEMFSLYLREPSGKPREQELEEVSAMIRNGILAPPQRQRGINE